MPYSVLLVDHETAQAQRVSAAAHRQHHHWQLQVAHSVSEARMLLSRRAFEVVAVRHRLPDGTAFELRRHAGDAALVIGVEAGHEVVAVRAMRQGFADYWIYDPADRYALALPTQIDRAGARRRQDVQRNAANARLATQNRLLQAISHAHAAFMAGAARAMAFDGLLSDFLALSHSSYGFIAEMQSADEGARYLRCHAVVDLAWDEPTRVRNAEGAASGFVLADLQELLGGGLQPGDPLVRNRPPEDGDPFPGLPPGHPPVESFVGLPVMAGGEMVGLVGLANRPGGYGVNLIELIAPLANTVAQLLLARRSEADRAAAEEKLRESETRWRDLTALSSDWYWESDEQLRITRVEGNKRGNEMVLDHMRPGMHPWELPAVNFSDTHWRAHRAVLDSRQQFNDLELEMRSGDSKTHWVSISGRPVFEGEEFRGYRGVGRNVSARKQAEARVEWLAFVDDLTGLPNRRLLLDQLEQALGDSTRLNRCGALLLLDLDNFKDANDTLGAAGGDRLLAQVAGRLRGCVRPHDTVARVGGDEFMVLLEGLPADPATASAQAEALAQAILLALGQPYAVDYGDLVSTPSIGIVIFQDHKLPTHELVKRADLAMYEAKAAGRNTYCFFDPSMQDAAQGRMRLESELRQALARETLCVYYQPVTDRQGRISGVEALVRWPHHKRGMVSPADFIPVAERTGLIVPLGRQVLTTACRQLAAWGHDEATRKLTIAVNVSAREFRHAQFVQNVLSVVEQEKTDVRLLKLEITESLLLHDLQDTITKMTALRSHGITFSLDDFGTGYSSLSYLKRLPFDQLKIDQSFVRGVLTDPHDAAVACTIIQLARSFGLAVVAEGVETEGQRDYLLSNGCEQFQGYLFGRPVPVEQLDLQLAPAAIRA